MIDLYDGMLLVGLLLLGGGVYLAAGLGWALIVVGGVLVGLAVAGAVRHGAQAQGGEEVGHE